MKKSKMTTEQKAEIDRRWELHKKGKSKSYTIDEVRKHISDSLKAKNLKNDFG